jgi:hypothetical protein
MPGPAGFSTPLGSPGTPAKARMLSSIVILSIHGT